MKKLLTILVLIMLIISFFQITSMYALYKEQIEGEYKTSLGIWAIKVNGTEITSGGQDVVFNITDDQLQYVSSDYIQAGKIAPGGQAYVDIVIDPTDTDVSIIYQIDIVSNTNEESMADFKLISAEDFFQKDGETEKITNETKSHVGNSYTGVIPVYMITQGYKDYVRLYFEWTNVEDYNETDSALGATLDSTLSVPLQINLKQYTGKE